MKAFYIPKLTNCMLNSLFLYLVSVTAVAAAMADEIEHLLRFVENTNCQYERNGEMYTGKEAAEHIKKKYNYFKEKIDTAEKFIELSATKSTLSGKYYMVHCNGKPKINSQKWLLQELENYRTASY